MLQQAPTPPSGPRATRTSGRLASGRMPNRGGIRKRNATPSRVDKDGDLVMEAAGTNIRPSGSGPIRGSAQGRRRGNPDLLESRTPSRPSRTGIDASNMQKAVLRGMRHKGHRTPRSSSKAVRGRGGVREVNERLDKIIVWGLMGSNAASNHDGGVEGLIGFLERKAALRDGASRDGVKIKKSRREGDALIIFVRPEDTPNILTLNKYTFAGSVLKIDGPPEQSKTPLESDASSETPNTIDTLKAVLSRRYSVESKLLDLSQLGSDPELVNIGMFSTSSRESKFFPALMKICDSIFTTAKDKEEAIVSISLANNALPNVSTVTSLSQTFPAIKNLDLSNNQFKNLAALDGWRWKFRKLDHLILTGNPIEIEEPNYKIVILKWYPSLRILNTMQVRSNEEVQAAANDKLLLPVVGPSFRDEASIAENFVRQFFSGYDSDRTILVNSYYDAESTFSLSINTSAPREESTTQKPAAWDQYIKRSRNLTKLTHLPTRMSRLYTGTESVRDAFLTLPASRHPNLSAEPHKWCIECHTLPGLPDPAGQSASGVGGLIVMIHGEFSELDVSTGQTDSARSFDRTFILGPGRGVGSIRIACDMLVLRAYGGHEAWKPEEVKPSPIATIQQQPAHNVSVTQGFGVPRPGKTEEQVQKEALAVELSRATGMTLEYSGLCLEQSAWSLEEAAVAYEQAKASLPAEAFVSSL